MVWRWVLMVCVTMVLNSWLLAQPKVTVQGTLKGYFITPQEELILRSVILSSSDANETAKEELHLLWMGYYFEGWLKSEKPVKSITIFADGHLIWKRELPKSILQGAVPNLKLPLQLHPLRQTLESSPFV